MRLMPVVTSNVVTPPIVATPHVASSEPPIMPCSRAVHDTEQDRESDGDGEGRRSERVE